MVIHKRVCTFHPFTRLIVPVMQKKERVLYTKSLIGLQAAATLHIFLGQLLLWSDVQLDIMGDASFPLFFIVSGCIVLAWYKTAPDDNMRVACEFWGKNFVRIAPLYYLSNLVVIPLYVGMQASVDYTGVVFSIFFLQCWITSPALNGITWIVSTFVFLYFVTPFIMRMRMIKYYSISHAHTCIVFLLVLQGILYGGVFCYGSTFAPQLYILARSVPLVRLPVYMSGIIIGVKCHDLFKAGGNPLPIRRYGLIADICITLYIAVTVIVICLTSKYIVPTDSIYGVSLVSVIRAVMEMMSPFIFIPIVYTLVIDETVCTRGAGIASESRYGLFLRSRAMEIIGPASFTMYMLNCVSSGSISLLLGLNWIGHPGVPVGSNLPVWYTLVSFILSIAVGVFVEKCMLQFIKAWMLTRVLKYIDDSLKAEQNVSPPLKPQPSSVCTPDADVDNRDRRHPLFHSSSMEEVIAKNYLTASRMVL
jgi:peptidoglycan/LPS O-acetylase OafA/YrhL